jgi:hypothetical protein
MAATQTFDAVAVQTTLTAAKTAAAERTAAFLKQHGDRDACGFAWVTVYSVRSNSKLGKALVEVGFRKAYDGGLQLWNPSGNYTQAITAKEVGAEAYATILREKLGVDAQAGSRMD